MGKDGGAAGDKGGAESDKGGGGGGGGGAQPFVYQKPKPQKNVMLGDLFDLMLKPAKVKGKSAKGGEAESSGASKGKPISLTMGHRQVKESGAASSGTSQAGATMGGFGKTQTRGKEKMGPKKVRSLSTIRRHPLCDAYSATPFAHRASLSPLFAGAPLEDEEDDPARADGEARPA
jgi:hypothetical protein